MFRIRIGKECFAAGFRAKHIGEILYAKVKSEFAAVVDRCQVKVNYRCRSVYKTPS